MKETKKNEDAAVFRNELVRILSGDRRILGVCYLQQCPIGRGTIRALRRNKGEVRISSYAKNNCYFPSRKRCSAFIESFRKKPEHCQERLMHIIRTAAEESTIEESVRTLRKIGNELIRM